MLRRQPSSRLLTAAALALAQAASAGGVVLAQGQAQLSVRYVQEVPVADPQAPLWDTVAPLEVPLTAQQATPPMLLQGSVSTVRVRAVHDGRWIAFLLEWQDDTQDLYASRPDQFRDAAAIQLPVDPSRPGVCMGFRGQPVNLWHWKADWQADIDEGFRDVVDAYPTFWKDYYPYAVGEPPFRAPTHFADTDARAYLAGWAAGNPLSDPLRVTPVEELAAMGFGSAEHRALQQVLGRGVWRDGTWRVVYARPMASSDPQAVQFRPGAQGYVAFAVWNGANQEVSGRKQTTADLALVLEALPGQGGEAPRSARPGLPWWAVLLVGVAAMATGGGAVYGYLRWAQAAGRPGA